jgi:heme O synthase-like polyprenyltransferase
MTAIITEATLQAILSATYNTLSSTFGVAAMVVLLLLLLVKEVRRARGGGRSPEAMKVFDIAIVPLLIAFVWVMLLRMLDLVGAL